MIKYEGFFTDINNNLKIIVHRLFCQLAQKSLTHDTLAPGPQAVLVVKTCCCIVKSQSAYIDVVLLKLSLHSSNSSTL